MHKYWHFQNNLLALSISHFWCYNFEDTVLNHYSSLQEHSVFSNKVNATSFFYMIQHTRSILYVYLSVQCIFFLCLGLVLWFWCVLFFLMQTILDNEIVNRLKRMILHTEGVIILQAGCLFALLWCLNIMVCLSANEWDLELLIVMRHS